MNEAHVIRVMSGEARGAGASAARGALRLLEPGYGLAVRVRNAMFDRGWRRVGALGRPTVSVGNLTTGGTGKTPMVIELVHRLQAMGERPAVLLRGYGQDETLELAAALEGVPVEPDPDRLVGAQRVLERDPGVSVFVLDDGFQHRRARRDLDLVLLDATRPFGFGHLLPRGLLREPVANLRRADAVIVTRADQVDAEALAALDREVATLAGKPPLAHAATRWAELQEAGPDADGTLPMNELARRKVVGVCGIGNPEAFERSLAEAAGEVAASVRFGDHYAYGPSDLKALFDRAAALQADALVTTEKDWVKWRPLLAVNGEPGRPPLPVLRPAARVAFLDGGEAIGTLLQETCRRGTEHAS